MGNKAGYELRTCENFDHLGCFPEGMEVMVIAGLKDGKVAPDETRIAAPHVYVEVDAAHSFIMNRADVIDHAVSFINHR